MRMSLSPFPNAGRSVGVVKWGLRKHVAKLLNIQHEVVDAQEGFQKGVVDDFIQGYLTGTTPNPCVRCNERVKFGSLYQLAKDRGAELCGHRPLCKGTEIL